MERASHLIKWIQAGIISEKKILLTGKSAISRRVFRKMDSQSPQIKWVGVFSFLQRSCSEREKKRESIRFLVVRRHKWFFFETLWNLMKLIQAWYNNTKENRAVRNMLTTNQNTGENSLNFGCWITMIYDTLLIKQRNDQFS